jgi:hypothetical protein
MFVTLPDTYTEIKLKKQNCLFLTNGINFLQRCNNIQQAEP